MIEMKRYNPDKKENPKAKVSKEELEYADYLFLHDLNNKLVSLQEGILNIEDNQVEEGLNRIKTTFKEIIEMTRTHQKFISGEELDYWYFHEIFKQAVSRFSKEIKKRKIKIINNCPEDLQLLVDSRVVSVIANLIDNSLKYAGKKNLTEIKLSCEKGKDEIEIIYQDNGEGIKNSEKKKIFEKNYGKGTGLGLYLIEKICQSWGWKIKEEGRQGEGVKFIISVTKQGRPRRKI